MITLNFQSFILNFVLDHSWTGFFVKMIQHAGNLSVKIDQCFGLKEQAKLIKTKKLFK